VPPSGKQALGATDSSWSLRSSQPFTRFKGALTGMCFSINLRNDCAGKGVLPELQQACCLAQRPPAFLQIKFPAPSAVSDALYPLRRATLGRLPDRCRLSYGLPTATINGVRRFPRALDVAESGAGAELPGSAAGRVFSVPLSSAIRSQQQQSVEFCLFATSVRGVTDPETGAPLDCSWESLCGLEDGSVPGVEGDAPPLEDRSKGCQLRLIGRDGGGGGSGARGGSAPCCTVPTTVTAYDSSRESYGSAVAVVEEEARGG
jgi:hypothetical protein